MLRTRSRSRSKDLRAIDWTPEREGGQNFRGRLGDPAQGFRGRMFPTKLRKRPQTARKGVR